ncbi:hypothetical protein NUW58_g8806 [Xylaria curta]|uniref:Uncharacterized protein n=1 Tax=Xylaria curta TaxID=42375 RepID=A0ACC1N4R3_9PEZI|nr:hypothetical protein NUW58_g8806 [Xylaria curta]
MEFTNPFAPSRQERFPFQSEVDRLAADPDPGANTRLSRNVSLGNNFSYPRLSRHESSESRSSEGSMPGMTDASDSDISFDEDCIYNTSANELWDSFWPDKTAPSICRQSQEEHLALLRARRRGDDSKFRLRRRRQPSDVVDDTIVIASGIPDPNVEEPGSPRHMFQPPASQPTPKKSAVTYSVYPKLPAINVHPHPHPHPHPPRTSSLGPCPTRPSSSTWPPAS